MKPSHSYKRSYHPFVLIGFYLNFLPPDILQSIPHSTLYDWKHKDHTALFGASFYADNKKLFNALEAVAQQKKLQHFVQVAIQLFALVRFIKTYQQRLKINFQNIQQVAVNHIQKVNKHLPLPAIFKLIQLDTKTYYQWRRGVVCKRSVINRCIIKHPAQLLPKEIMLIKEYSSNEKYSHWPLASLYHQMKREGNADYYVATFYKYCKALQIQRLIPKHRRKNKNTGIRVNEPLQLLHIDVTIFTCLNRTKTYIYVIKDNCSRAILHCSAQLALKAGYSLQALTQVYEQYKQLLPASSFLMTDGGSENSSIKNWISCHNLTEKLQHIVAQTDTHFSNSMVEAANRSIKYYGLYKQPIADFNALQKALVHIQNDHLHKPLQDLNGRTPYEVLHKIPYPKNPNPITAQTRLTQNKLQICCSGYSF